MKKVSRVLSVFVLSFLMVFNLCVFNAEAMASKISREDVLKAGQKTVNYYHENYKRKEYKGILDWPALGLYGFGEDVSSPKWTVNGKNGVYFREEEVKKGIMLSKTKNTDFQRTIIGVCAAGKDPRNFGGMNLVDIEKSTMLPSGHFADSVADNTTGKPVGEDLVNAHIFGIISLHCAGEEIPNKQKCLEWLQNQQHNDGGFTWDVKSYENPKDYELIESGVDMTAAALMAFAILDQDDSNPHVKKALKFIHTKQLDSGGFESWGSENPESCSWVIQAIRMLGQDPLSDEWTNAKGENPVSALLKFQLENGAFTHVLGEDDDLPIYDNAMSTEQALYGLADAYNEKGVYDMLHEKYKVKNNPNMKVLKQEVK
ncbi:prenyltransferase/squalene oxidase repeat-containing protein [Tepidibacter hydrothermalis]|uniref:Terpene cyclase/mutase family protein n=1 Tax=Tepidibacter hydrothermalis TaxID=3036126 RepID=A0ABY8ECP9_9FIRM|nr:prenyltransferase/squalene oxidase repeat-containing protein [Tepidibacter hydrothermalis]WFD10703.1 terpene cyclase/mutase family protein [Tepidibacter hydrothermalis]